MFSRYHSYRSRRGGSGGGSGSRMPLGGRLTDDQIAKIRTWIQEGAQEN
jgi:hypothetical protein